MDSSVEGTRFVIIASPRTGSNLVIEMLNSHPDCCCGYELFNQGHIEANHIPWYFDDLSQDPRLLELRRRDPVAFLAELDALGRRSGFACVGFKLMYWEGEQVPVVRDHVLGDRSWRVIHVRRRNQLQRLVSIRRAERTGHWWVARDERASVPPVTLSLAEVTGEIAYQRQQEQLHARLAEGHEVLELFYEDITAGDPLAIARQLWSFLRLRDWDRLDIHSRKTGTDRIQQAIANHGELRAEVAELAAWLDGEAAAPPPPAAGQRGADEPTMLLPTARSRRSNRYLALWEHAQARAAVSSLPAEIDRRD